MNFEMIKVGTEFGENSKEFVAKKLDRDLIDPDLHEIGQIQC